MLSISLAMTHHPYPADHTPDHHRFTYIMVTIDPRVDKALAANPRNLRGKLHNPRALDYVGLAPAVPPKPGKKSTEDHQDSSIWRVPKAVDPEMVLAFIQRTRGVVQARVLDPEWRRKKEL